MNDETEDLLRLAFCCPWCEAREVWIWDKAIPGKFAVACSNPSCSAIGPFGNNRAQAISRWNAAPRRTPGIMPERLRRVLDELAPPAAEEELKPSPVAGEWTLGPDD